MIFRFQTTCWSNLVVNVNNIVTNNICHHDLVQIKMPYIAYGTINSRLMINSRDLSFIIWLIKDMKNHKKPNQGTNSVYKYQSQYTTSDGFI